MRRRRRTAPDPAVVRAAADALADAERELAGAEAAHRAVHAAALAHWAAVARSERPPEDVRAALARTAADDEYRHLLLARAAVEAARRAYHAALREGVG